MRHYGKFLALASLVLLLIFYDRHKLTHGERDVSLVEAHTASGKRLPIVPFSAVLLEPLPPNATDFSDVADEVLAALDVFLSDTCLVVVGVNIEPSYNKSMRDLRITLPELHIECSHFTSVIDIGGSEPSFAGFVCAAAIGTRLSLDTIVSVSECAPGNGKALRVGRVHRRPDVPAETASLALMTLVTPGADIMELLSWVQYHQALGIERFYVYFNNFASVASIRESPAFLSLTKYLLSGTVVVHEWPLRYWTRSTPQRSLAQTTAMRDAHVRYGRFHKFLGFMDSDEYLWLNGSTPLLKRLSDYPFPGTHFSFPSVWTSVVPQPVPQVDGVVNASWAIHASLALRLDEKPDERRTKQWLPQLQAPDEHWTLTVHQSSSRTSRTVVLPQALMLHMSNLVLPLSIRAEARLSRSLTGPIINGNALRDAWVSPLKL